MYVAKDSDDPFKPTGSYLLRVFRFIPDTL